MGPYVVPKCMGTHKYCTEMQFHVVAEIVVRVVPVLRVIHV